MEFYNQESSQSSGGGFSMATPSPSPLTPTPPSTQMMVGPYEKIPSPNNIQSNELSPFSYLGMYSNQQSPVKLTSLNEHLALDYGSAPGISPIKSNDSTRQYIKTRKFFIIIICLYV